jgi:hypothetical protein
VLETHTERTSADLVLASRLDVCPSFTWLDHRDYYESLSCKSHPHGHVPAPCSGTGFARAACLDPDFRSVLLAMCHITEMLEIQRDVRRKCCKPRLAYIARLANEAHHDLLTLNLLNVSSRQCQMPRFQNAVWLAAKIYSDMVIFPLPASCGILSRLAAQLRKILQSAQVRSGHIKLEQETLTVLPCEDEILLLWVECLGAIASVKTSSEAWFQRAVLSRIEQLNITTQAELRKALMDCLWWDYICDYDTIKLITGLV